MVDLGIYVILCIDPRHTGSLPIHGEASAKAALYRDRFLLLFQRLARDQHFSRPAFDTERSHVGSCEVRHIYVLCTRMIFFVGSISSNLKNLEFSIFVPIWYICSNRAHLFFCNIFDRYLQFSLWLAKRGEDGSWV